MKNKFNNSKSSNKNESNETKTNVYIYKFMFSLSQLFQAKCKLCFIFVNRFGTKNKYKMVSSFESIYIERNDKIQRLRK